MNASAQKIPRLVLLAVALASLVFAASQMRTHAAARAAHARLTGQREHTENRLRAIEEQMAVAEKNRADLQARADRRVAADGPTAASTDAVPRGASVASPPPPAPPSVRASAAKTAAPIDALLRDPKVQSLYLAGERARLADSYAPLFKKLRLSAAQIARFQDAVMKRREHKMDLADIAEEGATPVQSAALARLDTQSSEDLRATLTGVLGEPGYRQFEDYERNLPAWELVNRFAGAIALQGDPVSEAQATQLTEIIANSSPDHAAGGTTDLNTLDWPAVVVEAAVVLSPRQEYFFSNSIPRYPVDFPVTRPPGAGTGAPPNPGPPTAPAPGG